MLRRLSVVVVGAALIGAAMVVAGTGGASAMPGLPRMTVPPGESMPPYVWPPSPSPSTPPPPICPAVVPVSGSVAAVTATSMTISYSLLLTPPCGFDTPIVVTLFASKDDAQRFRNPVARAVSGPERFGKVTVDGLTPDTEYWVRFSAADRPVPWVVTTGRTKKSAGCAATVAVDTAWNGGYIATVTVRNEDAASLKGWNVSWRWPGDERIVALWNAERKTPDSDVVVGNAHYNGQLAPGGQTTFGMVVTSGKAPGGIAVSCSG